MNPQKCTDMDDKRIAYIDIAEFDDGRAVRGAILVSDTLTEPIEFRCTSPIRPTVIQRTLWGGRLNGHIATVLVAKPLLAAITNPVNLIVVRKAEFLEHRDAVSQPMVQLLRQEQLSAASLLAETAKNDTLDGNGRFDSVVLKVHKKHVEDRTEAQKILKSVFQTHDVFEPFDRIANALAMVHNEEAKRAGA